MDLSFIPDGLFKTLLTLWNAVRSTFVTVYDWMGRTGFGGDGTVLTVLVGSGLFVILGYWIVKFINPF